MTPALVALAGRAARRIRAGLSALAAELPTPAAGERLVPVGDNGMYEAVAPHRVIPQWLGLAGFLGGQYWLAHVLVEGDARGAAEEAAFAATALRVSLLHRDTPESSLINETFSAQFGPALGFRLTGDARLRDLALATSDELAAHFHPHLEMFPRWPTTPGRPDRRNMSQAWSIELDDVVATIDENAGAGILYWSSRFRSGHRDLAVRAQASARRHGLIAPDGKVTQAVMCTADGRNVRLGAVQGSTSWTRAQAWGVASSGAAFEATRDGARYDDFERTLTFYRDRVIGAGNVVPPYDAAVAGASVPRDTCSAAIVAAAILRVARGEPARMAAWMPFVERTLDELLARHLTPGGTLLHACWGNHSAGVKEVILPFGNYYLTEAVVRVLVPDHPVWDT